MAGESTLRRYRSLYARLLRCYPEPYRKRFAEAMEQTFGDLCRERQEAGDGVFRFVLWAFAETCVGVMREMVYATKESYANLGLSAISGLLAVLPFVILEGINTAGFARSGFPLLLFTLLWMLGVAFVFILLSVRRSWQARRSNKDAALLVVKVSSLGLIAWLWAGLIADQMPCFLGASGC